MALLLLFLGTPASASDPCPLGSIWKPVRITDPAGKSIPIVEVPIIELGPWPDEVGLFGCSRDESGTDCPFEDQLIAWTEAEEREVNGRRRLATLAVRDGGVCFPAKLAAGTYFAVPGGIIPTHRTLEVSQRRVRIELTSRGEPVEADLRLMPSGISVRTRNGRSSVEVVDEVGSVSARPLSKGLLAARFWRSPAPKPRGEEEEDSIAIELTRRVPIRVTLRGKVRAPVGFVHGWSRLAGVYDFEPATTRALTFRGSTATYSGLTPGHPPYVLEARDGDRVAAIQVAHGVTSTTVSFQEPIRVSLQLRPDQSSTIREAWLEDASADELSAQDDSCPDLGRPWRQLRLGADRRLSIPPGPRRCLKVVFVDGSSYEGTFSAWVRPAPRNQTFVYEMEEGRLLRAR
ncbi:MAG: hypothetical protein HY791_02345 [Deltaproteobacteria bacterium]|nr:hypothetical protein [Deltaproteobacteria bacterium]